MGRAKETEFFNTHFDRGTDWYESFFGDCGEALAIGEISNNYYLDPEVAHRIRAYSPQIKLIVNLRNPFDLLGSTYGFGIRRGLSLASLEEALEVPIGMFMGSGFGERQRAGALTAADRVPLLESVLLAQRLAPFLDSFDDRQLYVFIFERLKRHPLEMLQEVYEFLGVDTSYVPPMAKKVINPSIVPRVRILGTLASRFAYLLRSLGFYGLLQRLHRTERLKSLLFKVERPLGRSSEVRCQLSPGAVARIEADIRQLKARIPGLSGYWG